MRRVTIFFVRVQNREMISCNKVNGRNPVSCMLQRNAHHRRMASVGMREPTQVVSRVRCEDGRRSGLLDNLCGGLQWIALPMPHLPNRQVYH